MVVSLCWKFRKERGRLLKDRHICVLFRLPSWLRKFRSRRLEWVPSTRPWYCRWSIVINPPLLCYKVQFKSFIVTVCVQCKVAINSACAHPIGHCLSAVAHVIFLVLVFGICVRPFYAQHSRFFSPIEIMWKFFSAFYQWSLFFDLEFFFQEISFANSIIFWVKLQKI